MADKIRMREHVILYGLLVRAVEAELNDKADQAVRDATIRYASGRGARMAKRAKALGLPLDMAAYFALKEWRLSAGEGTFRDEQIQTLPFTIRHVFECPWKENWWKEGMRRESAIYCRDADVALIKGFNPDLRFEMHGALSCGDDFCVFHYLDAPIDDDFRARQAEYAKKAGADAVKPFSFHAADLFNAFNQEMAAYGAIGQTVMDNAKAAFIERCGAEAWEKIVFG